MGKFLKSIFKTAQSVTYRRNSRWLIEWLWSTLCCVFEFWLIPLCDCGSLCHGLVMTSQYSDSPLQTSVRENNSFPEQLLSEMLHFSSSFVFTL